jgi:hypothetical protein
MPITSDLLVLERDGGHHEILHPLYLVSPILLESLQALRLEVFLGHQVIMTLLLTELLNGCGYDVVLVELASGAYLA